MLVMTERGSTVLAAFTRRSRQNGGKERIGQNTTAVGGRLSSSNEDVQGENRGGEWGRASSTPRHTNHKVVEMGEGSAGTGNGDMPPRVETRGEQWTAVSCDRSMSRDRICEDVFSGEISAKTYSERRTEGCKKDEKDTEKEERV